MSDIHVPDVPGPTAQLCWAQGPLMNRCDRSHGHAGRHTWELEGEATRLRVRWAQLKTDVALYALHPDPHGFDNGAAASFLLDHMGAMEAEQ